MLFALEERMRRQARAENLAKPWDDFADAIGRSQAMMAQMFKGMKVSAKLVVPSGIQKTNATYVKDNTVTLLLMDFDEIMKNKDGMKALKKLEGATRAELGEALKGVKGAAVETKPKIRVRLK